MSTRRYIILTCDGCRAEAPLRFPADRHTARSAWQPRAVVSVWMTIAGWQEHRRRDLCPACVTTATERRNTLDQMLAEVLAELDTESETA